MNINFKIYTGKKKTLGDRVVGNLVLSFAILLFGLYSLWVATSYYRPFIAEKKYRTYREVTGTVVSVDTPLIEFVGSVAQASWVFKITEQVYFDTGATTYITYRIYNTPAHYTKVPSVGDSTTHRLGSNTANRSRTSSDDWHLADPLDRNKLPFSKVLSKNILGFGMAAACILLFSPFCLVLAIISYKKYFCVLKKIEKNSESISRAEFEKVQAYAEMTDRFNSYDLKSSVIRHTAIIIMAIFMAVASSYFWDRDIGTGNTSMIMVLFFGVGSISWGGHFLSKHYLYRKVKNDLEDDKFTLDFLSNDSERSIYIPKDFNTRL